MSNSIVLPLSKKRNLSININDIIFIKSNGHMSQLFLDSDNHKKGITINDSLGIIEKRLIESKDHFRCHKQYIVNLKHVEAYIQYPSLTISLKNGEKIPLARRRRLAYHNHFKSWIKK